jgi:hypothetical protein
VYEPDNLLVGGKGGGKEERGRVNFQCSDKGRLIIKGNAAVAAEQPRPRFLPSP